jgi:SAM-dependent methyltransferase
VLQELSRPNLELKVHDVVRDELPDGEFDLVHFRLLLAWLDEPQEALRRMVASLKPGGWLLGMGGKPAAQSGGSRSSNSGKRLSRPACSRRPISTRR